jgi:hypothetical protein
MSARINNVPAGPSNGFGAATGISSYTINLGDITTLSPNHTVLARDLSVSLVEPPPASGIFLTTPFPGSREIILQVDGIDTFMRCTISSNASGCTSAEGIEAVDVIGPGRHLSFRIVTSATVPNTASVVIGWRAVG